jgi:hypothetical protein
MRMILFVLAIFLSAALLGGCRTSKADLPVWQSNKRLLQKNNELEVKIKTLETENKQLKQQADTLANLDKDVRIENLYHIQSIYINTPTGIYTKEKDQKPRLIIYFSPLDDAGDSIKASGSLEVELWNIGGKQQEALVHKWEIAPNKLKKDWGSALMGSFYRITLDLPENMPESGDFLIRVSFTDYLSGKVLTARKSLNKT